MKIQQRTSTAAPKKNKKNNAPSASFGSMFDQQNMAIIDAPVGTQPKQHKQQDTKHNNQPLNNILNELEAITQNLDADSKDHKRAQLAINSLRDALHDMPEAFPLTAADREEARTLLTVEAKRIEELRKYEG